MPPNGYVKGTRADDPASVGEATPGTKEEIDRGLMGESEPGLTRVRGDLGGDAQQAEPSLVAPARHDAEGALEEPSRTEVGAHVAIAELIAHPHLALCPPGHLRLIAARVLVAAQRVLLRRLDDRPANVERFPASTVGSPYVHSLIGKIPSAGKAKPVRPARAPPPCRPRGSRVAPGRLLLQTPELLRVLEGQSPLCLHATPRGRAPLPSGARSLAAWVCSRTRSWGAPELWTLA